MTMTVGKDANNAGKFSYEIHGGFNLVEVGGNYPTMQDAQSAAKYAYRAFHASKFSVPNSVIVNDYMSLDDIFAEIES